MSINMEIDQSIIHEVVATLEKIAAEENGPDLRQQVVDRIESYVDMVKVLLALQSPADVLRLKMDVEFQKLYGEEIRMNNHIQTILFFGERGLIDFEGIPEETEEYITHPAVQLFATIDPECFVLAVPEDDDPDEQVAAQFFDEIATRVVTNLAVRQIVGPFNFWVDPQVICPTTYLSVHSLSSTLH